MGFNSGFKGLRLITKFKFRQWSTGSWYPLQMGLNGLHPCFGVGSDEKNQEGRSEKWTERRRKKKKYDVPYIIRLWVDESVSGWLNWWRLHLHGYRVSLIVIRLGLKLRASCFFFFFFFLQKTTWKCYLLQHHQLAAVVLNRPPRGCGYPQQ